MRSVSLTLIKQVDKEVNLTKDSDGYGTVDIWRLMQCLALDVIGETAFGQTFHMLEDGTHPFPTLILRRLKIVALAMSYPTIAQMILTGSPHPRIVNVGDTSFMQNIYLYIYIHIILIHSFL